MKDYAQRTNDVLIKDINEEGINRIFDIVVSNFRDFQTEDSQTPCFVLSGTDVNSTDIHPTDMFDPFWYNIRKSANSINITVYYNGSVYYTMNSGDGFIIVTYEESVNLNPVDEDTRDVTQDLLIFIQSVIYDSISYTVRQKLMAVELH